jgi:hypothetical protein
VRGVNSRSPVGWVKLREYFTALSAVDPKEIMELERRPEYPARGPLLRAHAWPNGQGCAKAINAILFAVVDHLLLLKWPA